MNKEIRAKFRVDRKGFQLDVDLKLPGMSGLDALGRLQADGGGTTLPVIVISGHGTVATAVGVGAALGIASAALARKRQREAEGT
jgi:FixJ family two-component response regulator